MGFLTSSHQLAVLNFPIAHLPEIRAACFSCQFLTFIAVGFGLFWRFDFRVGAFYFTVLSLKITGTGLQVKSLASMCRALLLINVSLSFLSVSDGLCPHIKLCAW